jgi:hypothetical protein
MVDTDFTTMPPFTERNWQWHFNRSTTGDSRLLLLSVEILFADLACNWVTYKQDDSYEAVKHLGRALHALQDWYAHGDFNRNRTGEMPTIEGVSWNREIEWYWHNFPHQGPVDDAGMDSEGTEGRATMNVMSKSHKFSNGNVAFRANFHPGPIRITRTGRATRRYLSNFMQFVFDNSKPCGACQSTFLQTR